ncbi:hypothetical protein [Streptoalloteichus hindustanus]|uniref:Circularly permuted type 2 ATP-grasp protein n=1 Tax=Streptoalloteichus hindustanus TaxID=2017 RepID=A0A1M4ZHF2_STRHI|nr:hypothetical protein [Streptoalloteichus hindustanus]SHF17016.1 hypothetical protein SAMN05444320_102727 [Streptoalloteichus hindustanus]
MAQHSSRTDGSDASLFRFDLHFGQKKPGADVENTEHELGWEQFGSLARQDGILPLDHSAIPMAPALTGLDPDSERTLGRRLTSVLGAVERLARHYEVDSELRRFLNLPPLLHEYALADVRQDRYVDHCRLDLGGDRLSNVRIFEIGGDYPVSNMNGLLNRYWRRSSAVRSLTEGYRPARSEEPGWMAAELLDVAARRGVDGDAVHHIGILCTAELRSFTEVRLLESHIRHHGRTPALLVPDQLGDDELPLAFLVYPNQAIVENPERHVPLLKRIASGELIIFNGVRGRFVGGNKLVSAALSDPRFRSLFTADQNADIDALVPWSRKLDDGVTAGEAVARRTDLVLKAPFDVLSRSVFVGWEQSPAQWRDLVRRGAREGWLVQEFVPSQYVETATGRMRRTLGVVWCGGRVVGYNGRITPRLVDVFPTGGLHAVFGDHSTGSEVDESS